MRRFAGFLLLCVTWCAWSQGVQPNVLVQALREGTASQALPAGIVYEIAAHAIQEKTGDAGPIVIVAHLMRRFQQQPLCGRVAFVIAQPSSHQAWRDLGGQLNICESGEPPMRACENQPGILVPVAAVCTDGSQPRDTSEVQQAIKEAVEAGGLSREQVRKQLAETRPNKPDIEPKEGVR